MQSCELHAEHLTSAGVRAQQKTRVEAALTLSLQMHLFVQLFRHSVSFGLDLLDLLWQTIHTIVSLVCLYILSTVLLFAVMEMMNVAWCGNE